MASDQITGEQLSALAYSEPRLQPEGFALGMEIWMYIAAITTSIIVGLRVYVRAFVDGGRAWGTDDYLAVLGYLPFIPTSAFGIMATHYGLGSFDSKLNTPKLIRAGEYTIYYLILYYVSSTITKIAIAYTLLRLFSHKRWIRWVMHINWIFMTLTAIACLMFVFINCKPFAANYNPLLGTCLPGNGFIIVSYSGSVVQVITDWVCALVPFFVVKDLQMTKRRKVSLLAVLMLGILASIVSLVRMFFYKYYDRTVYPDDYMYHSGQIAFMSSLECGIGIAACSLPPLRMLFKNFFRNSTNRSQDPSSAQKSTTDNKPFKIGTQLTSLTPQGKSRGDASGHGWDRLDDDNSSGQHIVKKTEISVEETSSGDNDYDSVPSQKPTQW